MSGNKSLVAFTLLVQSAIGSIWLGSISMLFGAESFHSICSLFVAFLFVIAGMVFSTGHLGRPSVCFYALKNLRHSWLSREIAGTGVFAALLATAVLSVLVSGSLKGWFIAILCAGGAGALYTMMRAYQLRTVPSWNHTGTLFAFLSSTMVLGGLQEPLTTGIIALTRGNPCEPARLGTLPYVGFFMTLAGLAVKAWFYGTGSNHTLKADLSHSIFLAGMLCWIISITCREKGILPVFLILLAALCLVTGEVRQRISFYHSFRSAGLQSDQ
jgi:DMSO reductase anchor subunit